MKPNTTYVDSVPFNHCAIILDNNDQENSTLFFFFKYGTWLLLAFSCSYALSTINYKVLDSNQNPDRTSFFPALYVDNRFIADHLGPWNFLQKAFPSHLYQSSLPWDKASTHWALPEKHLFPDYWRQMGCKSDVLLSYDILHLNPNIHPEVGKTALLWSTRKSTGSDHTIWFQIYHWALIYKEGQWNK